MQLCSQCGSVHRDGDRFCAACGAAVGTAASTKDPLVGRTLAGSYLILDLVGVGGMGRVYRAEQRMLGRTVAIKVVHPHLLSDEQSVARFYNEARAASRLNHPNSVSIIDFGRTDDGILYLVMEFLQGRDLARVMREDGPLPLARICELLIAVLAALGEAHALGVVHRDLKPENIIIERLRTGSDLIKVVDFGLAKLLGAAAVGAESSVTSPGLVCGTPDYMSPEQGRGLPLDGRGDLYAVGVILFELLTEHLPYIADTPTNVVLRHIQDPIPDVREEAPERNIPPRLGEVCTHALAKLPEDRFQTAHEMAAALRRALGEVQPGAREISCRACGMRSPSTKRFCGECGAPLMPFATPSAAMPRMSLPPRMTISRSDSAALIGREAELQRFEELSQEADGVLLSVCLLGEAGVGKTRLLAELADRANQEGTLVVGAGPHDSGALVPYHTIRTMLLSLLGADDVELFRLAEELVESEPLIAAGMRELLEPSGLRGADGRSRAGAVAAALAYALREGMRATERARVLILVDDLHRCDGLTVQTLAELPEHCDGDSVLLVIASQHAEAILGADAITVSLRGLSLVEAHSLLGMPPPVILLDEGHKPSRTFVPLYIGQLRALGHGLDGSPARLADAVLQRTQRLDVAAVRALQAACVLGNRCPRETLLELVGSNDTAPLEALERAGLLVAQDGQLDVVHPFVRDLVEGSIPAEARKALHARALGVAADAPLEVRAHHAYGAGETLSALMLLERVGDLAYERGDAHSAVQAYRRGLDLVRRELLESGDTSFEEALASFSRRLGNALARNDDVTGAEGVLREALEFCPPHSIGRAHILLGLGRVVANRQRLRDAYRLLGEAVEIAIQRDDEATQAAAHLAVGELRVAEGNAVGAVASFGSALQCLSSARADALTLAKAAVSLAAALALGGDARAAADALQRAQDLAQRADAPHLQARALTVLGELHAAAKDTNAQQETYRKARIAAARAGDAHAMAALDQRLHELIPPEDRPTLGMK